MVHHQKLMKRKNDRVRNPPFVKGGRGIRRSQTPFQGGIASIEFVKISNADHRSSSKADET
jgi:hypothetical protein